MFNVRERGLQLEEGGRSLQLSVWAGQTLLVIKLIDCLYVIIISRPDSRIKTVHI